MFYWNFVIIKQGTFDFRQWGCNKNAQRNRIYRDRGSEDWEVLARCGGGWWARMRERGLKGVGSLSPLFCIVFVTDPGQEVRAPHNRVKRYLKNPATKSWRSQGWRGVAGSSPTLVINFLSGNFSSYCTLSISFMYISYPQRSVNPWRQVK